MYMSMKSQRVTCLVTGCPESRLVLETKPCRDVMCKPGVRCWVDPCSGGESMMVTDVRKDSYDIDTAYSKELCKPRGMCN